MAKTLEIRRDALAETRVVEAPDAPLAEGEARLRIERFAITANNVSYAVTGGKIGYWRFFPATGEGWIVVPVWGVAEVAESRAEGVRERERLYGFLPMSSHLTITPGRVRDGSLFDAAPHRADLPPVYNRYMRLDAEPGYDRGWDGERMTLWPLFATSYCLYDFLLDNDWFGARRVILPSASSKTAIGTAYALKSDPASPPLVGITSARNAAAVGALGLYDEVMLYDEIEARLDAATPSVIIDMSGSGEVIGRLHRLLGDNMRHSAMVGLTHYEDAGMGPDYIRERSKLFFAPGHIQKRSAEWGPGEFDRRAAEFFAAAALKCRDWLTLRHAAGADAAAAAWGEVLAGKTPPDVAWTAAL